ncbi:zinc-binding dehydrogenase [Variovorax ginsengisoli]|uniref:Zinc-binding dehydrogenase n=1 Tax=Variovorax ginsengisoli TaxID=363844 RepID=A0ABT8SBS7_9BURK|nr:zinc-binding dehydrogenase [Variovorax ginsengisoli]MDN8616574.1 zinc-binding dehydrogenase [Variovorax ginsengisoli]MDO1535744.1 zinc-binding dehydrogenase [Variovorax ginsengisoli]
MKAAVFRGSDRLLAIEELPLPQAGAGELVLRVHYCGVCGSDLHATHPGLFTVKEGTVLGHEFAGEIVESGATAWKVGERATALPNNACRACTDEGFRECRDGLGMICPHNRLTGFSPNRPGALAEYVKVPAGQAIRLPGAVNAREGAMIEPLAVGLHAVQSGQVGLGCKVLVIGAGPIGLAVTAFARQAGATRVAVSERAPGRREVAARFGATALIDPAAEEVGPAFARHAGGPPDVIFECVGVAGLIQQCIELAPPRGRIVVVGVCATEDRVVPQRAMAKELNLQFVMGYAKADWRRVLDLLDAGRVDPQAMLTDVVGLDELPAAFEALRRPTTQIKLLVAPGGDLPVSL